MYRSAASEVEPDAPRGARPVPGGVPAARQAPTRGNGLSIDRLPEGPVGFDAGIVRGRRIQEMRRTKVVRRTESGSASRVGAATEYCGALIDGAEQRCPLPLERRAVVAAELVEVGVRDERRLSRRVAHQVANVSLRHARVVERRGEQVAQILQGRGRRPSNPLVTFANSPCTWS